MSEITGRDIFLIGLRRASGGFCLLGAYLFSLLHFRRRSLSGDWTIGAACPSVQLVGCRFRAAVVVPAFHRRLPSGVFLVSAHRTASICVSSLQFGGPSNLERQVFFSGFCISFDFCSFGGAAPARLLSEFLAIVQEQRTRQVSSGARCSSGGFCRLRFGGPRVPATDGCRPRD